ncbi:hypothetical protein [Bacillus sp. C1]
MKKRRISTRNVETLKETKTYEFDFQQAYDYFLSAKKSEGLREKTITSHEEHFRFFLKWVSAYHPELKKVSEVTTHLIREYMVYMYVATTLSLLSQRRLKEFLIYRQMKW